MEGEEGKESETTNTEDPGESVSSLVGREQVGARGGCNQPQHRSAGGITPAPVGFGDVNKGGQIRFKGKEKQ